MQTDIWLTQSAQPNQCPLCSKPLKASSKTCYACGFSLESPAPGSSVWIDPAVYSYRPPVEESQHTTSLVQPSEQRPKSPASGVWEGETTVQQGPHLRTRARSAGTNTPGGKSIAKPVHNRRRTFTRSLSQVQDAQPGEQMWQYESPNFEAGSSLPALSLIIAETPTQPGITLPELEAAGFESSAPTNVANVEEIDTVPEQLVVGTIDSAPSSLTHVDQIDTIPELSRVPERALVPVIPQGQALVAEPSSWTAGGDGQSSYARHIAGRGRRKRPSFLRSLNPFDHVRWWLLRPGRIEFLLWLGGTILLIGITCILLLVTAFSLNWITPGVRPGITSSSLTSASPQRHVLPTITGTPGLVFTLLDKGPLLPGQSLHVHGSGFTPRGKVIFTLDGTSISLNGNGTPGSVQSDTHGEFTTTLSLGYGPAWTPGPHLIIARDVSSDRLAVLSFVVAPPPIGKGVTATATATHVGVTATPTVGKGGTTPTPISTPVSGTPAPPTPTATPSPTPTPSPSPTPSPTPKPTPSPTPKPTPTAGMTPTAGASPTATHTAAVPLSSLSSHSSNDQSPAGGQSLSVSNTNTAGLDAQPSRVSPWLWLPVLFYTLAMLMLGIAGVLHKRRV